MRIRRKQTDSDRRTITAAASPQTEHQPLLDLQRHYGNAAVQRLIDDGSVRAVIQMRARRGKRAESPLYLRYRQRIDAKLRAYAADSRNAKPRRRAGFAASLAAILAAARNQASSAQEEQSRLQSSLYRGEVSQPRPYLERRDYWRLVRHVHDRAPAPLYRQTLKTLAGNTEAMASGQTPAAVGGFGNRALQQAFRAQGAVSGASVDMKSPALRGSPASFNVGGVDVLVMGGHYNVSVRRAGVTHNSVLDLRKLRTASAASKALYQALSGLVRALGRGTPAQQAARQRRIQQIIKLLSSRKQTPSFNRVKLVAATSCNLLAGYGVLQDLFPNALVIGYTGDAPLRNMGFFAEFIMAMGQLDLNSPLAKHQLITEYRAFAEANVTATHQGGRSVRKAGRSAAVTTMAYADMSNKPVTVYSFHRHPRRGYQWVNMRQAESGALKWMLRSRAFYSYQTKRYPGSSSHNRQHLIADMNALGLSSQQKKKLLWMSDPNNRTHQTPQSLRAAARKVLQGTDIPPSWWRSLWKHLYRRWLKPY